MKYKIFVSAHQKELREERFAIKEVINDNSVLRGFFDVFLFEDLPAKGKSAVSTYLKNVSNSDLYICIIGSIYNEKKIMNNREYREIFKVTDRTALRDLNILVSSGMIQKKGFKKDAVYFAK